MDGNELCSKSITFGLSMVHNTFCPGCDALEIVKEQLTGGISTEEVVPILKAKQVPP